MIAVLGRAQSRFDYLAGEDSLIKRTLGWAVKSVHSWCFHNDQNVAWIDLGQYCFLFCTGGGWHQSMASMISLPKLEGYVNTWNPVLNINTTNCFDIFFMCGNEQKVLAPRMCPMCSDLKSFYPIRSESWSLQLHGPAPTMIHCCTVHIYYFSITSENLHYTTDY